MKKGGGGYSSPQAFVTCISKGVCQGIVIIMSQITNIHGHEVLYDGLTNTVKIRYMNPKNVLRGNRNLVELFLT